VFAATIARLGSLRVRVTHVGADTTFGRVIKLVEEAEAHRADVQRIADTFSAYYLPVVAAIAALTFLIRSDPLSTAAVLVVACSCSFALATPIAMLASVGAGAKRGLLIKGGKYLETLARADVLLVDKTGTLTLGRPQITDVIVLNGMPANEVLALAASAERYSEHPLAEAVRSAAREAIGPNNLLMVDAGGSDAYWQQGYKRALRTAEMLANYDVAWFEEPLKADTFNDYIALRRAAPLPISGGEVLTRRQSFQTWIEAGAFDIVQPDVTKVGGISEERRIGWMAQEHGIRFIPHGWNTAIGLAADLQLASAFADTDLVAYLTGSPFIDEIVANRWQLDSDGMLAIPTAPGLSTTLDRDALAKYTRGERWLDD